MRIFVSHAWEDKPLALKLAQLPEFVAAWVDVRELAAGQELDPTVVRAIDDSHVFVVLLGHASLQKAWVAKEVTWALEREARRDRVFVLPIMIDRGIDLAGCNTPFDRLHDRLFIDAADRSDTGIVAAREALTQTLFRWASDWVDRVEPPGDSDRRFVEALEVDLGEYQTRLFAVKAALAWPLSTLVTDAATAHLVTVKDRYNAYTDVFMPRLASLHDELRWRFGASAQRAFAQLSAYLRNEVFHGAAFALNDVIESINAYDTVLRHDAHALSSAEARRVNRVEALQPVLDRLVRRTGDFIETLK